MREAGSRRADAERDTVPDRHGLGTGSRVIVGRAFVCAAASMLARSQHPIQDVNATNREVLRRVMAGRRNALRWFARRSAA